MQIRLFTFLSALITAFLFSSSAHAGDSYYRIVFNNTSENNIQVTILPDGSHCTQWFQGGQPSDTPPPITIAPKDNGRFEFTRGSWCKDEMGQVNFTFTQLRGSAGNVGGSSIYIDYSALHEINTYTPIQLGDIVFDYTFTPYYSGDMDLISINILNTNQVDIETAVGHGCTDGQTIYENVQLLSALSDLGSITASQIAQYKKPNLATSLPVTSYVWGYRASYYAMEETALEQGYILSKAMVFDRKMIPSAAATSRYNSGPMVYDRNSPISYGMQALALGSSSAPVSQFASVATNFSTTTTFGKTKWTYAFQFKPGVPLRGIRSSYCTFANLEGELQFQALGGTPVRSVMRRPKITTGRAVWEVYDQKADRWTLDPSIPESGPDHAWTKKHGLN